MVPNAASAVAKWRGKRTASSSVSASKRWGRGPGPTEGDVAHVLGLGEAGDVGDLSRRFAVRVEDLRSRLNSRPPPRVDEFLRPCQLPEAPGRRRGGRTWRKTLPKTMSTSSRKMVLKMTVTRSMLGIT